MTSATVAQRANLLRVPEDQPLWRVFKPDHLVKLFTARELVLVAPRLWDDPFENFLQRCLYMTPAGERVHLSGLTEGFFGLCWTDQAAESDATWRIYAPEKNRGMRVRVRAGALFNVIDNSGVPYPELCSFLGKVEYEDEATIRDRLARSTVQNNILDPTNRAIAETLLVKRTPFRHEAEVRLLYQEEPGPARHANLRAFPCDPHLLVEHVLLDPRWTLDEAMVEERRLRQAGYTGPIDHSTLYRVPQFEPLSF